MRLFIVALVLVVGVTAGISAAGGNAFAAVDAPVPFAHASERQPAIDDNDDTRVEVQLVLGAVGGLVLGVGIAAYLLKRRLGLIAPPPDQTSDGHH